MVDIICLLKNLLYFHPWYNNNTYHVLGFITWCRCSSRIQITEATNQSVYDITLFPVQGNVGLGYFITRHLYCHNYGRN